MVNEAQKRMAEGESRKRIADSFGVDESGLRKRMKKGFGVEHLGRFKSTFTPEQENTLAEHCRQMDARFYGLTYLRLRSLAYEFAERNRIQHKFNKETKTAGKDWALSFAKRYKFSLRIPQKTSVGRIMGFNKAQVDLFFQNLEEITKKINFTASCVFNIDEVGITTVPNKTPKILTPRGKRCVSKVSSAERGQTVTAICCMSASGNYVPPALIFPRKRPKAELMDGCIPEATMFVSESGYVNSELFVQWLKHFKKHVRTSAENQVLLILDNHSSHISLECVTYAKNNYIHLLSLPPHSSHKMQPLDRTVFKVLKDYYGNYCEQWMSTHPGRIITQYQVAGLFAKAYEKTASIGRAVKGFETCGIWPIDKHRFGEEDFLPSSVTDQPQHAINPIAHVPTLTENLSSQPSTSGLYVQNKQTNSDVHSSSDEDDNVPLINLKLQLKKTIQPADIVPYPKIQEYRQRKGKSHKSKILTSTPNKKSLEEERQRKLEGEQTKTKRKVLQDSEEEKNKKEKKKVSLLEDVNNESDTFCSGCGTKFEEPIVEDWIQCSICKQWWHEKCTSYEQGEYRCDLCL